MWEVELLIASHDKPTFRNAPPADTDDRLASPEFIEGHLGYPESNESLIRTQDRLREAEGEVPDNYSLQIKGSQGNLFPKGSPENPYSTNKRATSKRNKKSKQKAIEDWRREQGLEGTNVLPPWANASIMDENTIDPKKQRKNVRDKKILDRAKSGQQGADIAKDKLTDQQKVDIPTFLETMEESFDREQIGDEADIGLREGYSRDSPADERIKILTDMGRIILNRGHPAEQLEYATKLLSIGGVVFTAVMQSLFTPSFNP